MNEFSLICSEVYRYIATIYTVEREPPTLLEICCACHITEHQGKLALARLQARGELDGRVPVALLDRQRTG